MSHAHATTPYIPAAGRHWRLPFYDPMAWLVGAGPARRQLVEQLDLRPGDRVLDLGTGTGELAIEIARRHPRAEVVGLDPDPRALQIARRKGSASGLTVRFEEAFADALPFPDAWFDSVACSLMFHHLDARGKERALGEIQRVLRPGGRFHMLDFDGHAADEGFLTRRLHAHAQLRDNAEDRVLSLLSTAGFEKPHVVGRRAARFTRMIRYRAEAARQGTRS